MRIRFFNLLLKRDATNEDANHTLTKDNTPGFSKTVELAVELRKSIQNTRGLKCLANTRKSFAFVIFNIRRRSKSGNKADPCPNLECPIESSGAKKR